LTIARRERTGLSSSSRYGGDDDDDDDDDVTQTRTGSLSPSQQDVVLGVLTKVFCAKDMRYLQV
jgi:hypothetical protein